MKRWDGPKTLYDMVDVPDELKPFVPDYKINLVEVAFLEPETIKKFTSDFRIVAEFFRGKRLGITDKTWYNNSRWTHVAELIEFFRTFTGDSEYNEIKQYMVEKSKKGEVRMCEFLDAMLEKGRVEGRVEGRFESVKKIVKNGFSEESALKMLEFTDDEATRYYEWKKNR